ncbi:MAG: DNA replication/repair protein RecF [Acidimicrobiales bacterium]
MVSLAKLEVIDFRSFSKSTFEFNPSGTTVLLGENGTGKTSVIEAVAFLGSGNSFRGTARDLMIRSGCERSVLRADVLAGERRLLVEGQIRLGVGSYFQINRQATRSATRLSEAIPVVIFSPDDLELVQGGPGKRREYLDRCVTLVDPLMSSVLADFEKVLRQRATLLRQSAGRPTPEILSTLDVWDERLGDLGNAVVAARAELVEQLNPYVKDAYSSFAGRSGGTVGMRYKTTWTPPLRDALATSRREDIKRGVNTTGPHRDELDLELNGRLLRSQASQGEQRCMALSLKLGFYQMVVEKTSTVPILLLDDVFSELDPLRSEALMNWLPVGQSIVTTSTPLPGCDERGPKGNLSVQLISALDQ